MNMHKAPRNERHDRKGVVLLIDDDAASLADMVRILGLGGYDCRCASDLDQAVEQLRETVADLLIADLAMAGPGGRRLLERIHRAVGYFEAPLMFLSRGQGPDIIHRHGDYGAAYYLRKPFDVMVLLELVDKSLCAPRLAVAH
jgi:CheY-like chemotaxis protein